MKENEGSSYHLNAFGIGILLLLSLISLDVSAETESERKNAVSVAVGNTQNGSLNGATIALGYERRLSPLIGVGGFAEYAGGDFGVATVGAKLLMHPHAGWEFKLAPGVEFDGGERDFLFRVGVAYEFEIVPRWSLAPEVNVDFVDGERQLVYGVSAQYEF